MIDVGLLLIRAVLGAVFVGHGGQKLFGWFGGAGLDGTAGFFEQIGFRPGRPLAILAGLAELLGGLLLLIGFATPLAAAAIIGVMVATYAVHAENGFWNADGGYEFPLVLATVASGLAVTGSGAYAIDNLLGWSEPGWIVAVGSILIGLVAGAVMLVRRERMLAEVPTGQRELQAA